MDADAVKVVRKLRSEGHEAYLVGGCVRDLYLGLRPKDFDAATSATPKQIHRLFRNSRIIGRRFQLVHVFYGPKVIETSTFRTAPRHEETEGELLITQDNEWGSVEDDALRRDFTVNGLFCDVETGEIVDFVDGLADLDARSAHLFVKARVHIEITPGVYHKVHRDSGAGFVSKRIGEDPANGVITKDIELHQDGCFRMSDRS